MNVAIFTDNDFTKVNGVRTALRAVLDYAPPDVHARIYTCEDRRAERSDYIAMGPDDRAPTSPEGRASRAPGNHAIMTSS